MLHYGNEPVLGPVHTAQAPTYPLLCSHRVKQMKSQFFGTFHFTFRLLPTKIITVAGGGSKKLTTNFMLVRTYLT
jgi:hypothetical protein